MKLLNLAPPPPTPPLQLTTFMQAKGKMSPHNAPDNTHQDQPPPRLASCLDPSWRCGMVVLLSLSSFITIFIAVLLSLRWREGNPWPYLGPSHPHTGAWVSPWSVIRPDKHLVYTKCFGDYQCARLEVPMDWNSTTDPDTVALAIIKLPARVPVTDQRYGGTILINPGGPGGSGVDRILDQGFRLQNIVDSTNDPFDKTKYSPHDRYYDIIGYDGRGINNTTPRFECFTDPFDRQRWTMDNKFLDLMGSSDVASKHAWTRAMALAETCSGPTGPKLGRFMNTTPAIADIIEIIERHGEWREKESNILLSKEVYLSPLEKRDISNSLRWVRGGELLQYWGFSYGSVTGATFAAMQPHRVKRLIVDGICDANAMYNGLWTTSIFDTDLIMDKFFEECHEAGPVQCSYYSENGPSGMKANLDATLQLLNNTPLAVAGSGSHGPDIITYSDILRAVKETVYNPLEFFPQLADLVTDVSKGNGSEFAAYKKRTKVSVCQFQLSDDPHEIRECPPYSETSLDTLVSISCTDGQDLSTASQEAFQSYYNILRQQSKWMADYWVSWTLSCWRWKTRPLWRYDGQIAGETKHPMLWIGNTLDPATPLKNAFDLSANFPGSVVLQQDSVGHCSYSSDSQCTNGHVRRYFHTGELPPPGTICPPDKRPWGLP